MAALHLRSRLEEAARRAGAQAPPSRKVPHADRLHTGVAHRRGHQSSLRLVAEVVLPGRGLRRGGRQRLHGRQRHLHAGGAAHERHGGGSHLPHHVGVVHPRGEARAVRRQEDQSHHFVEAQPHHLHGHHHRGDLRPDGTRSEGRVLRLRGAVGGDARVVLPPGELGLHPVSPPRSGVRAERLLHVLPVHHHVAAAPHLYGNERERAAHEVGIAEPGGVPARRIVLPSDHGRLGRRIGGGQGE
mmetsp:Transcript_42841/g.79340  ORF Transcript_42841/g.79340 Transcript_42841/m.79340 type:complete len:243 (-) Transcript_42841:216-944(-)